MKKFMYNVLAIVLFVVATLLVLCSVMAALDGAWCSIVTMIGAAAMYYEFNKLAKLAENNN